MWLSDELSKPTCKEFGAQNFKQIEIFLSPFLSVSNCPGDLTESCYTRCDFRSVVSGFNNVFIFIVIIFGCPGILKSFVVALPAEAAACAQRWERCEDEAGAEMETSVWRPGAPVEAQPGIPGIPIPPHEVTYGSPPQTHHPNRAAQNSVDVLTDTKAPGRQGGRAPGTRDTRVRMVWL